MSQAQPPPPPSPSLPSPNVSSTLNQLTPRGDSKLINGTSNSVDSDRGWILHRNREQPTPDPNDPPLNQIRFYLDRYKIKEALQVFLEEDTLRLLHEDADFMWDLIPIICRRLRGLCQYRFRVFEGCERMLLRVAIDEHCNPKEVLISLLAELSQSEQCEDDNVFRAMIRPLESTLLRMNHPSPRDENFRWVLNVLIRHINEINVPQDFNIEYLEGKKRNPAVNDEASLKRFIEVLPLLLNFIEEFNDRPIDFDKSIMPILSESQLDEVFDGELVDDDTINELNPSRGDILDASINALFSIMNKPLALLDLSQQSMPTYCPDLNLLANRCLSILIKLRPGLFAPAYKNLDLDNYSSKMIDNSETLFSLGICLYIYRCERIASFELVQFFPQVITHQSMLLCHIPFVVGLLDRSEILANEKGLILLESLLKNLAPSSLNRKFLDILDSSNLTKHLFRLIVYSPLCTNRRKAYDIFTGICDLLENDSKLELFRSILTQTDLRPCVRAACIDQYRRHLTNMHLRSLPIGGQNLIEFLDLCIGACLPDSQHTDIIENYELLLATLTMLRFLKLRKTTTRDPLEDEHLSPKRIKKQFFEPIRCAISSIRIELKKHHKEVAERDEVDCLNWALCRLDLVESVLVRTCDLYNC